MTLFSTYGVGVGVRRDPNIFPEMDSETFLHIFDVFSKEWIEKLFELKGQPGVLLSDHIIRCEPLSDVIFYGLPLWLARESKLWATEEFESILNPETKYCFNFMINKKQLSRYLLIKLVEIFKLSNYNYTWSGIGREFDMCYVIGELQRLGSNSPLTSAQKSCLLAPINIDKKFIDYPESTTHQVTNSARTNYGGNKWSWDNALRPLFTDSAISLISESGDADLNNPDCKALKASTFTEKTLYSVLGLTFPIWIGGYGQAAAWNSLGFDIFDDVIDHSYQYYDTIIERCYWAFAKNLKLLKNIDDVKHLRQVHLDRLIINRKKILDRNLDVLIQDEIDKMPVAHRTHANTIWNKFLTNPANIINYTL